MIKLEDLKKNDIVYAVCEDKLYVGLYAPSKVYQELNIVETSEPIEAVWCDGEGLGLITKSIEKYLFRTEDEAKREREKLVLQKAEELLKSDYFFDRLLECSTSIKRLKKTLRLRSF